MRSRMALALWFALLIPACAGSPRLPLSRLSGWHAVDLGSTRLIGDLAPEELQRAAVDLARFDAIFAKLAGWPASANAPRLEVYLVGDHEIAKRFGLIRQLRGWEVTSLDASYVAVNVSSGLDASRNILLHEYTHVLLARNQHAPLPRWLNEGLATYFMTVNERSGAVVVGAVPAMWATWVSARPALSLDRVFASSTDDMSYEELADFYATSWAFSHYLMSDPARRRELAEFIRQLAKGVPIGEAQSLAFGRSVDQLGAELATHIGRLTRGVAIETSIDASAFPPAPAPPPVIALEPRQVAGALGMLALELAEGAGRDTPKQNPDLALGFLELALGNDTPLAPEVEAALGEALAMDGDGEAGSAAVEAALARAPNDPRVRLYAAREALLRAEAEDPASAAPALAEAEAKFLQARALAPESAAVWFGLGQTLAHMGRTDDARAAFETARSFGWSAPLDVALARIEIARGDNARAADLLRPIAQDPHVGAPQKEAADLLKQISR